MATPIQKGAFWSVMAVVFLCIGVSTQVWMSHKTIKPEVFHGTVLDHPRVVQAFELMGTDAKPFNLHALEGHWTFLFFGFTQCASVCPISMAELGKTVRLMAQKGIHPEPRVVMITLDPERDTQAQLKHYVQAFYPDFMGARGSLSAINGLAHDLGIASVRVPGKNPHVRNDTIEHTGAIILINPQGQLAAFFTPPHRAAWIMEDYQHLLSVQTH